MGRRTQLKEYLSHENIDCVAQQEMIKSDFSFLDLKSIDPFEKFCWQWAPAAGHSGGLLLGIDKDIFIVEKWSKAHFFLSVSIHIKASHAS